MKLTDKLLNLSVELWQEVSLFKQPSDQVLSNFFKLKRKQLGSSERELLATTVYTILRNYNRLTKLIKPKLTKDLIILTWLKLLNYPLNAFEISFSNFKQLKLLNLDSSTIEFPTWLQQELSTQYNPQEIFALSEAMRKPAILNLRVNTLKTTRLQVISQLTQEGYEVYENQYSPYGISLALKTPLQKHPLFINGEIEVQDEGSQLAGLLLNPKRGEMVADFCAGSGGKSLLFGMLMRNTGRIYAFDTNLYRLNKLTPRLARSGLSNIHPQLIESEKDPKLKRLKNKFDRVFVDAPCSGLGTLKRNPDLKFRQDLNSLNEIINKQQSILNSAANLLKPDGLLVYATCSILARENQNIIDGFLKNNSNFKIQPIYQSLEWSGSPLNNYNYLELFPHLYQTDGFFACLLQKT